LQVWHEVEALIDFGKVVCFQNYFIALHTRSAFGQRQAEFELRLLDLRQKRSYAGTQDLPNARTPKNVASKKKAVKVSYERSGP
jgi:hypothetical protein